MRNLKFLAVMACAIFTLSSCETEDIQGPIASAKVKSTVDKDGGNTGGEEEEPIIIRGLTKNSSGDLIENAEVKLYDAVTNQLVSVNYTDANGDFEFSELSGTYYVVVSATGYLTYQSTNLDFPLNNGITFTLQEE